MKKGSEAQMVLWSVPEPLTLFPTEPELQPKDRPFGLFQSEPVCALLSTEVRPSPLCEKGGA